MSKEALSPSDTTLILDELKDVAPDASFLSIEEPEAFVFGQDKVRPAERLTGLERMGEKLGRALSAVIEPFARTRASVSCPKPDILDYGQWAGDLPDFTSLSLYRARPLKGGMLIALEPDFVAGLVESFYGGTPGASRKPKTGDFTTSEEMLLKRLLDRVVEAITEQWGDYAPIEPLLVQRETSAGHINFVRSDEPVVLQRFTVSCGGRPSHIQIVYPLAVVRPIEARLATKVHDDGDHGSNHVWRAKLGAALSQVSLPVRSVLARPEISVAQLLALKPGDVIPITLAPRTPLLAGTHMIADGVIGEQEGRAALMIEKVGND